MAGNISRIPRGFLNWLYSSTGGRAPTSYSDTVVATVDIGQLYSADRLSTEFLSFTPAAFPSDQVVAVPAGEVWVVRSMGISQTVLNVADSYQADVSVRRTPNLGSITAFAPLWSPEFAIATGMATPQRMVRAMVLPEPLVLQGGSELICTVEFQNAVRAITFSFVIDRLTG